MARLSSQLATDHGHHNTWVTGNLNVLALADQICPVLNTWECFVIIKCSIVESSVIFLYPEPRERCFASCKISWRVLIRAVRKVFCILGVFLRARRKVLCILSILDNSRMHRLCCLSDSNRTPWVHDACNQNLYIVNVALIKLNFGNCVWVLQLSYFLEHITIIRLQCEMSLATHNLRKLAVYPHCYWRSSHTAPRGHVIPDNLLGGSVS